jgi:hypothetical protein
VKKMWLRGTPVFRIPSPYNPVFQKKMVERRELITICRQIGTMMEVGVDFLRITRALRDQTDNPRLLELYDQLDHEMKMGESLADAISKAPDVFSPFAVSLVRQGEARGDIEGAWHRLADFLKQEAQEDKDLGFEEPDFGTGYTSTRGLPSNGSEAAPPRAPVAVGMLSDLIDWVEGAALRGLSWGAAFLLALAVVWWSAELGFIPPRWTVGLQLGTAAVFLGGVGFWLRLQQESNRKRQAACSFCGKSGSGMTLQRSPRLTGAAICKECAAMAAGTPVVSAPVAGTGVFEIPPLNPTVGAHPFANLEQMAPEVQLNSRRISSQGFTPSPSHEVSGEIASEVTRFEPGEEPPDEPESENEEVRFRL